MRYQHGDPNPLPRNEVTGKTLSSDPWSQYMQRFAKGLKKHVKHARVKEAAMGRGSRMGKAVGMVKESESPKSKIEKTMHEFKTKTLHSGSKHGPQVKSRKQAVAIALSQARKAGAKIPKK